LDLLLACVEKPDVELAEIQSLLLLRRNQSLLHLHFLRNFSNFSFFSRLQTYHCIVDFVRHHADDLADSIAQGHPSFDVLLGVVRPKNRHIYNLHCDLNIGELLL